MIRQLSSVVHNHYNSITQFATNSFSLSFSKFFIKPMFNSSPSSTSKKGKKVNIANKVYPFLPLNEHPLIPGMPRIIPVTKHIITSLNKLKDKKTPIIFSVMKNKPMQDLFLYKFTNLNFIPKIKNINEVNEIGCLCDITIKKQQQNQNSISPINNTLILNPLHICKIEKIINLPNPIGNVKAKIFKERKVYQGNLPPDLDIKYSFLQELLIKTVKVISDDNCRGYLISLKDNFNIKCLNELVNLSIASLSFPTLFMQYFFLKKYSDRIQELISILDIKEKTDRTIKVLGEMYKQLSTWEDLINQYDIAKDQRQTQKKVKDIYIQLKNMFEKSTDEKKQQVEIFKKNLKGKKVPKHIQKIIDEEISKYLLNDKYSMESNVIRNYLEMLTSLPYGITTKENFDLSKAKKVLDETHYGMDDVKERILESIAVSKLKGKSQGKILCFVGPPGVGKTSIGESIAKALNRKFYRISLGGDKETSAIKGFRRTYVGAIPGKIVKALKNANSENPVILLDEIDKLTERNINGDPSSVLLEVLDPEQNNSFTDDYLDTPIDLSKVMFICTANSVNTIPQALYDRMEIIEVSGYTFAEKKFIYEKYLKPKAIEKAGLTDYDDYSIEDEAVDKLINDYCRESGVRSLQRAINRIFERISLKKVQGDSDLNVTCDNLHKFLGPPTFSSKRMYQNGKLPKGVSIGLGFNNYGGSILYIESNIANYTNDKKGGFIITGNVGKVMNESCQIALTAAKNFLNRNFSKNEKIKHFLDKNSIHIHFTEGAIPKDGPSAGVTICTSLISLALNQAIIPNLAMTGEITLSGRVLKIGGLKEKVMAAKREGMQTLIVPYENMEDINQLDRNIKEGVKFYFVKSYDDIFNVCFPKCKIEKKNSINLL